MTDGLLVFVQLVIAAMTTEPSLISEGESGSSTFWLGIGSVRPKVSLMAVCQVDFISLSRMRS